MRTPTQLAAERALTLAAVAGALAHAARQRGGEMLADAAGLHALGDGPLWPQSRAEMLADTLPALARQPGHAGATVTLASRGANPAWHVLAAPLAPAVLPPLPAMPTPLPAAVAPPVAAAVAPPAPRPVAAGVYIAAAKGLPVPTIAEYEQAKAAAAAASQARIDQRKAAVAAEKRAIEHANNLRNIGAAS